jgi:hypothetical protein
MTRVRGTEGSGTEYGMSNVEKRERRTTAAFPLLRDRYVYLILIAVGVAARIPFLKNFDLVSYDGTYYIRQAESILAGAYRASVFPIGYPAFIALFIPLVRDGVRAAQTVSVLAGFGSLIVFHMLCTTFVRRRHAFLAGLVLACTPLFLRYATVTMSESIYLFWILLGLLLFVRERDVPFGLCMGMAAITRPEAIGVFGVLALLRIRRPRRIVTVLATFLAVYSINVAAQSMAARRLMLAPKTRAFGGSAEYWKVREAWIEFEGKETFLEEAVEEGGKRNIAADYLSRMPRELALLARHASPVLLLLALYGICRRRLFLISAFVPFAVFPIFTSRTDPRFVLPFIPCLILYAFIGLDGLPARGIFRAVSALLALSVVSCILINGDQLTEPVSEGYGWTKPMGRSLREKMNPGDAVADRKPYFAFYAGGDYVEIPVAHYDETVGFLAANGIEYLVLHSGTIHQLRPKLLPLLFDWTVINGELRYEQVFFQDDVLLYRRVSGTDPVRRDVIERFDEASIYGPSWSPDGTRIAFRVVDASGREGIYVIVPDGGRSRRIIKTEGLEDPISWSPDSKRIAFSSRYRGNLDIVAYDVDGTLSRITSHEGSDISPSWSHDGTEIVFCSDRGGQWDIWIKNLESGTLAQVTADGGYRHPSFSPGGDRIAWIRGGEGLSIYDRAAGTVARARAPSDVLYRPAWSPDGGFIAVTGRDWGSTDVYIVTADAANAALLTKTVRHESQPAWRPDGAAIAAITRDGNASRLSVLTGIEPYRERLLKPYRFAVLAYER